MQFKVPQNVQREDRIVGPLTLKQLLILGGGGIVAYGIYVSLARTYIFITWLPPVAIVAIITLAFAFAKPLGLSFTKWILRWVQFSLLPKNRFWVKSGGEVALSVVAPQKTKKDKKDVELETDAEKERKQKMKGLQKFLEAEQDKKLKNK